MISTWRSSPWFTDGLGALSVFDRQTAYRPLRGNSIAATPITARIAYFAVPVTPLQCEARLAAWRGAFPRRSAAIAGCHQATGYIDIFSSDGKRSVTSGSGM